MSVQERLQLSAVARRLFTTAPEVVIDAVVGITAGANDDPMLLLGALHVGDGSVVDSLLGFTAPDDWLGIGVVAGECRIAGVGASDTDLDTDDDSESTRVVYLLDRSGEGVTALGPPSDAPTIIEHRVEEAHGHLVDVCRRCLGLPTSVPTSSTAVLIGAIWLDRVADLVLGSDDWPGWPAIARLHPAVEPFSEIPSPERISILAEGHAAQTSWARARAQATLGRLVVPGIDPELASWMDVGMFARWSERAFIDPADLLGAMTARFGDLVEPIRFITESAEGR